MDFEFTWDPRKAAANERKHRITFAEAATAFDDPLSMTVPDPDHSEGEARYLLVGRSAAGRLLVASHVDDTEYHIHIISARGATRRERRDYEEERGE